MGSRRSCGDPAGGFYAADAPPRAGKHAWRRLMTSVASRASAIDSRTASVSGRWRRHYVRARHLLIGGAALLAALVAWEIVATSGAVSEAYIGTPVSVAQAGWAMIRDGELWTSSRSSLIAFAIGLGLSIVVGAPLGLIMGWSKTVRGFLQPPIMALYVMPRLALLPIIVVWLGVTIRQTVVVVVIGAIIPVIINAMVGVRDSDPKLIQVARSFGCSQFDLFRKILLPSAIPLILAGVRLSVGSAVLGVVISEMYVSTGGLGHLITAYGDNYNTSYIVFLVLIIAIFGWLVSVLVRMLERRVESWRA